MKSVKEVSMITGITEQNIRYYVKRKDCCPQNVTGKILTGNIRTGISTG